MISKNKRVKEVIDIMDSNGVGRGKERLADIIDKIYLDVDFTDKVVLDVGSGEGVIISSRRSRCEKNCIKLAD